MPVLWWSLLQHLSDASVCKTNVSSNSGLCRTGFLPRDCWMFLNAATACVVHWTLLGHCEPDISQQSSPGWEVWYEPMVKASHPQEWSELLPGLCKRTRFNSMDLMNLWLNQPTSNGETHPVSVLARTHVAGLIVRPAECRRSRTSFRCPKCSSQVVLYTTMSSRYAQAKSQVTITRVPGPSV